MSTNAAKFVLGVGIVLTLMLSSEPLPAQDTTATLSGIVTDSSGEAVPNAKVSVKNAATGESRESQSDSVGHYSFPNLVVGDYEISASADGTGVAVAKVALTAGSQQTVSLILTPTPTVPAPSAPSATPSESLPNAPSSNVSAPNAPSSNQAAPTLEDLGFSPAESQANAREQALLDKRTHMLKIHQRMGLITTIPMIASVVTSFSAGGKSEGTASRDLHVALGSLTGDLYGITAWYAIRAPRIKGTETRGPIRAHKILAWIHGPGMILTPILGAMAFQQKNNGEKVHGLAAAHNPVAIVTAGAFGAALLTVSLKF
jgi:hypothetical protein